MDNDEQQTPEEAGVEPVESTPEMENDGMDKEDEKPA